MMKLWWRRYLRLAALSLVGGGAAHAVCFTTPRAALDASISGAWRLSEVDEMGYRLLSIHVDPLLNQRWAKIASCSHSEWPVSILAVPASAGDIVLSEKSEAEAQVFVVHSGDPVRLWRQDNLVRVELGGVSEASGAIGHTITVRIAASGFAPGATYEQRRGVVRGPAEVELLP